MASTGSDSKSFTILIVENEKWLHEKLFELVQSVASIAFTETNGKDGLRRFIQNKPDIVICNLELPELGGLELIKRIKFSSANTPVVLLSDNQDRTVVKEALKMGVDFFLDRPFESSQLREAVEKCAQKVFANKRVELVSKQMKDVYDHSGSITLITNGEHIFGCNKLFLEFFGIASLQEFNEKYSCMGDLFVKKQGYISPQDSKKWLDAVKDTPDTQKKAILRDKNNLLHFFVAKLTSYPQHASLYIVSFTDMTAIEHETLMKIKASASGSTNSQAAPQEQPLLKKSVSEKEVVVATRKEIHRARRYKTDFCAVLFSVADKNDSVISVKLDDRHLIEKIVTAKVRPTDMFEKMQDNRYVLLAGHTDAEQAKLLIKRLLADFKSHEILKEYGYIYKFGVCEYDVTDSITVFLRKCDNAIAQSVKKIGNAVVILGAVNKPDTTQQGKKPAIETQEEEEEIINLSTMG